MASPGTVNISAADQKDLEKVRLSVVVRMVFNPKHSSLFQFIKYLAVKAVQVVVQARLGERVTAPRFPDFKASALARKFSLRHIFKF